MRRGYRHARGANPDQQPRLQAHGSGSACASAESCCGPALQAAGAFPAGAGTALGSVHEGPECHGGRAVLMGARGSTSIGVMRLVRVRCLRRYRPCPIIIIICSKSTDKVLVTRDKIDSRWSTTMTTFQSHGSSASDYLHRPLIPSPCHCSGASSHRLRPQSRSCSSKPW